MANYAVIENDKVVNAVVSDAEYAELQGWIILPDGVGIGWDYIDGAFVDNRPALEPEPEPEPESEPEPKPEPESPSS